MLLSLVKRAAKNFEDGGPDPEWWPDYFRVTGEHMILTEEGWEPGSVKAEIIKEYGADAILDEVNRP